MALRNLLNYFSSKRPLVSSISSLYNQRFTRNMGDTPVKVVSFEIVKGITAGGEKILVDVREPSELKEDGKIPNSVNVPLGEVKEAFKMHSSSFQTKYGVSKPDAETDFVISCKSGKRATDAYYTLRGLGYQNVSVYTGSFLDWVKNGGPVEK